MHWAGWLVVALLLALQADLWFGKGNLRDVFELQRQVQQQQAANEALRERNRRVQAEVGDLKEGLEMVEERARAELGMLRPNEILVQVTRPLPGTAAAGADAAPR